MKQIGIDIYNKLSTLNNNVYFNQLPANIDNSNVFVVYEINISDSMNTLDLIDYENIVDVRVKMLSKDVMQLFDLADEVKGEIFQPTANYKAPILKNSIEVFYDDKLQMNQYTLIFSVIKSNTGYSTQV